MSLVFSSSVLMCSGRDFFLFVLLGVRWHLNIELMSFVSFEKFSALKYYFCLILFSPSSTPVTQRVDFAISSFFCITVIASSQVFLFSLSKSILTIVAAVILFKCKSDGHSSAQKSPLIPIRVADCLNYGQQSSPKYAPSLLPFASLLHFLLSSPFFALVQLYRVPWCSSDILDTHLL